jgi:hypothetical protein
MTLSQKENNGTKGRRERERERERGEMGRLKLQNYAESPLFATTRVSLNQMALGRY